MGRKSTVKHLNKLPHADDVSWSMNVAESKKKGMKLQESSICLPRILEHVGFTIYVELNWKPIRFNFFHQDKDRMNL